MNDLLNKKIQLENGEEYVTIDYVNYDGITYFLGNDVIDNHLGQNVAIFKVQKDGDSMSMVIESDIEKCQKIIEKLQEKSGE